MLRPSYPLQKWQNLKISTVFSIALQENPVPRIPSHLPMVWKRLLIFVCLLEWPFLVENRASSDTFNGSTRNSSLLGLGRTWHHPAACRKGKAGAPMGREHPSAAWQWGSSCRMPKIIDVHLQEKKTAELEKGRLSEFTLSSLFYFLFWLGATENPPSFVPRRTIFVCLFTAFHLLMKSCWWLSCPFPLFACYSWSFPQVFAVLCYKAELPHGSRTDSTPPWECW